MSVNSVIPIGSVLFDQRIVKQGKMSLVDQEVLQVLGSQTWLIKNGKYEKDHWKQIIPYIRQLYVNELIFFNNPEPQILRQITSIDFRDLKWLFLSNGSVMAHKYLGKNNIQPIVWLSAPKLEKLILSNNQFTIVKPFIKLNLPKLAELHINGNPFQKVPLNLSRLADQMDCISFEEQQSNRVIACDISDYAKTNFTKLKLLQTQGKNRIRQKKVMMCLKRKFGTLKLQKQSRF